MGLAVEVLRLIPLIMAFYIPALVGMVILKERSEAYEIKVVLVLALGFGGILALRLYGGGASVSEIPTALIVSLVQIASALLLAALTVYKLAD
jgi:hypothetical protein